jgi:hypothetical protein
MKRTAKLLANLFIACLCMLIMSSCGIPSPPDEAKTKDMITEDMRTLSIGLPDTDEMEHRVLNVDSVDIERRQTNDKSDVAYCIVVMSDDQYQATAHYEINFEYYDEGGWYLENYNTYEKTQAYPLNGFSSDFLIKNLSNSYDSIKLKSSNQSSENSFIYEFNVSKEHQYAKKSGIVSALCEFSTTEFDWTVTYDITKVNTDWSKIIGKWSWQDYGQNIWIDVKSYVGNQVDIDMEYHDDGDYDNSTSGIYDLDNKYSNDGTNGISIKIKPNNPIDQTRTLYIFFDEDYGVFATRSGSPGTYQCTKDL